MGLYRINVYRKEQEQYITFCIQNVHVHRPIPRMEEKTRRTAKASFTLFRIAFDTIMQINQT